jgi:hypothetical protein
MIEPNIDILYRFLFVYLIIHIVVFVIDVIKRKTTYKTMNTKYYWKEVSTMSTLFIIDLLLSAFAVAVLVVKYILTGELL